MMYAYKLLLASLFLLTFITTPAHAEQSNWSSKLSGFATIGANVTNSSGNYLINNLNNKLSFDNDTILGIQLDTDITEAISFSSQLNTRGVDNFDLKAEWLYASYQWSPTTLLRAGRLRVPAFIASQTYYVGYSYPWIRPPEEVYQQTTTTHFNGIEWIVNHALTKNWELTVQPYVGNVKGDIISLGSTASLDSKHFYGAVLQLDNLTTTFRVSALHSKLDIVRTNPVAVNEEVKTNIISVGAQYDAGNWLLLSEYAKRITDSGSFGDTQGYYLTIGKHIDSWLPYVTAAGRQTSRVVAAQEQDARTFIAGVRYDLTRQIALKGEVQRGLPLHGTRGMYNELPSNQTHAVNALSVTANVVF